MRRLSPDELAVLFVLYEVTRGNRNESVLSETIALHLAQRFRDDYGDVVFVDSAMRKLNRRGLVKIGRGPTYRLTLSGVKQAQRLFSR